LIVGLGEHFMNTVASVEASVADQKLDTFAARGGMNNGPVPLEPYRSEEFFELERHKVFRRAWLFMGRVEDVPKSGDFVLRDVEVCKASVLIVRGKDNMVRAFHNVCAHRANQVESRRNGNTPAFVCPYHGWSYFTDGSLRGVPDEAMFIGLEKKKCGLREIALETWDGWVFINLSTSPEVSLGEFLGGFKAFYSGVNYINLDNPVAFETRLKCNWKVVSDAFAESYHIPSIHKNTLKASFSNEENPFGRLLDARFFGPHRMVSMFGNADGDPRAAERPMAALAFGQEFMQAEQTDDTARFLNHPAINPTKTAKWSMDSATVFPNFNLNAGYGGQFTHEFWPLSVHETRHRLTAYFPRVSTIRERFQFEYRAALLVDIIFEDLGNVERTQRGIDSCGTESMMLSESEISIRHSVVQAQKWAHAATVTEALEGDR
jgi:phenylpropionate dioxygenase-like ring-hydroxylating dioxygenase large terminal subunit